MFDDELFSGAFATVGTAVDTVGLGIPVNRVNVAFLRSEFIGDMGRKDTYFINHHNI